MNKISGIYEIRNTINNDRYIGSSVNMEKRMNEHRRTLNKNIHYNRFLQRAWNKYGEDNFEFNLLFECEEKYLLIEEQKLLDEKPIYNLAKSATAFNRGCISSEETKHKISANNGRYWLGKTRSEETKRKISENRKGIYHSELTKEKISKNNARYWLGKTRSKETVKKMSDSLTGRIASEETRQKLSALQSGKGNYWFGKKLPEEMKMKISKGRKAYNERKKLEKIL